MRECLEVSMAKYRNEFLEQSLTLYHLVIVTVKSGQFRNFLNQFIIHVTLDCFLALVEGKHSKCFINIFSMTIKHLNMFIQQITQ